MELIRQQGVGHDDIHYLSTAALRTEALNVIYITRPDVKLTRMVADQVRAQYNTEQDWLSSARRVGRTDLHRTYSRDIALFFLLSPSPSALCKPFVTSYVDVDGYTLSRGV